MKCNGCTERHPGCHSKCKDYQLFVQENEERKRSIRGYREKERMYESIREKAKRKTRGQW